MRQTARQIAELGADRIRITAGWSDLALAPHSPRRPDFDATDSRSYPPTAGGGSTAPSSRPRRPG